MNSKTPKTVKQAPNVTNMVFEKAQIRLKEIIDNCRNFKIGKTGVLVLEERRKKSDYKNTYTNIIKLYESKNKQLINELESLLIQYAIRYHRKKCDNISPHSHGKQKEEGTYRVYVVFV